MHYDLIKDEKSATMRHDATGEKIECEIRVAIRGLDAGVNRGCI